MKHKYGIMTLLLFCSLCTLQAGERWTLKECIEYAIEHNISLRQQKNKINTVKLDGNELRQGFLPDLSVSSYQAFDFGRSLNRNNAYEDSNSQTTSFTLKSEIPVFDGFARVHAIARNRYHLLAEEESRKILVNDISLTITALYFQILLNKEIYRIALEQIFLTREQEQKTLLLLESGKVPHSHWYDVKAQLADDELTATDAINALRHSVLDLVQLMELEDNVTFDIEELEETELAGAVKEPVEVFEKALVIMPQINQANYLLESYRKGVKVAQAGYYPVISLGAGITSGYYHFGNTDNYAFREQFRNNLQKTVYINFSMPLFDRFSTRNSVKKARLEVDNARLTLDSEKKELYKDIEKAYTDVLSAGDKLKATEKAVEANEEAHRYAWEKYQSGKSSVFEYNESKLKLANAFSQQAQAKYSYWLKYRVLEFYGGKLLY